MKFQHPRSFSQVLLSFSALFLLLASIAFATVSFQSPTTCSGQWTNCSNAFADNINRATATVSSSTPKTGLWHNYHFALPSDATIESVKVRSDFFASNKRGYLAVQVSDNGGSSFGPTHVIGGNTLEQTFWIDVTQDFAWTPATLSDANFQLIGTCFKNGGGSNPTCRLDWIPVEVTWTQNQSAFNFTLEANPSSATIVAGNPANTTVTATLISGTPEEVFLSEAGCPPGYVCSFTPGSGFPTFSATMFLTPNSSNFSTGTFPVFISGTSATQFRQTDYLVTIV